MPGDESGKDDQRDTEEPTTRIRRLYGEWSNQSSWESIPPIKGARGEHAGKDTVARDAGANGHTGQRARRNTCAKPGWPSATLMGGGEPKIRHQVRWRGSAGAEGYAVKRKCDGGAKPGWPSTAPQSCRDKGNEDHPKGEGEPTKKPGRADANRRKEIKEGRPLSLRS